MIYKFLKLLLLFLTPFILLILLNLVVDPFNYSNFIKLNLEKDSVTMPFDYRLFKLNAYRENPSSNILLGDSRIAAFNVDEIEKISGKRYFNFGYGGGTLNEVFETIEFASKKDSLKEIVIGLSFNLFDASNSKERVSRSVKIINNPLSYYFNFKTSKASLYVLFYNIFGVNYASEHPNKTKEEFWKQQLNLADNTYTNYNYPFLFEEKLLNLKLWCDKNQIKLFFILPPTHIDLQNKVLENNLGKEYSDYKSFLKSLGTVYDFDIKDSITVDAANFKDPYHFNDTIMKVLIKRIWSIEQSDTLL